MVSSSPDGSFQSEWHNVNFPVLTEGGKAADFDWTAKPHNLTSAVIALRDWIQEAPGYKESFEFKQVMAHLPNQTEQVGKSYALRLLTHYVGDIHSPLHVAEQVNSEHPSGDNNGFDFPLPKIDGISNLHDAFETDLYAMHEKISLPFTEESYAALLVKSMEMKNQFTDYELEDVNEKDVDNWTTMSYEFAVVTAYDVLQEGQAVDPTLYDGLRYFLELGAVSAGYRLAIMMQDTFGVPKEELKFL